MLSNILSHRYFLWGLLALPSIPMTLVLLNDAIGPEGRPVAEMLLHPTGEFAARFMIIAMVITPMRMLLRLRSSSVRNSSDADLPARNWKRRANSPAFYRHHCCAVESTLDPFELPQR